MTQNATPHLVAHWLVAQCFKEGTLVETAQQRPEDRARGLITDVSPDGSIQFSGAYASPADDLEFSFNQGNAPLRAKTEDGQAGQVLRVLWRPENQTYPGMHRALFKPDGEESFFVYRLDELSPAA